MGFSNRAGALYRFDSTGRVDYSYGQGGVAYLPPVSSAMLNTDRQDRVLYAGQRYGGGGTMGHFVLYRFLPNGSPDSSFATNGRLEEVTTQYAADVYALEQAPDGKIVVGENDWMNSWNAYRYLDNGKTDSSFGGNGRVSIFWRKAFSFTRVQPDNKVLFIGYDAANVVVVRVNEDGSWDSSYGSGGIAKAAPGLVEHAVVRPDGRLLMGGNIDSVFALWQLLPDGSVDQNFGQNGVVTLKIRPQERRDSRMTGLALQSDGKIIITGNAQSGPPQSASDTTFTVAVVARFFADGRLGVQEVEKPLVNALLLYPNPAGDVLKLAYPVLEGKAQIAVYDLTGRQLLHGVGASKSSAAEISVQSLTPGIYLVELRSEDGVAMQQRFIKQ